LNFATKKIETVVNDTYINAVEVMNLIDLIVSKYQNRIYLVLRAKAFTFEVECDKIRT